MYSTNLNALIKNKWVLVLGAAGVLLLIFGSAFSTNAKSNAGSSTLPQGPPQNQGSDSSTASTSSPSQQLAVAYETQYDKQLENILTKISGINRVNVMVTVDSTEVLKLANNGTETNTTQKNGPTSSTSSTTNEQVFTVRNQDGSTTPVVIERVEPQVRGVLVTVDANDFTLAKSEIIASIQNVLDVPAYKISVEPEK